MAILIKTTTKSISVYQHRPGPDFVLQSFKNGGEKTQLQFQKYFEFLEKHSVSVLF